MTHKKLDPLWLYWVVVKSHRDSNPVGWTRLGIMYFFQSYYPMTHKQAVKLSRIIWGWLISRYTPTKVIKTNKQSSI